MITVYEVEFEFTSDVSVDVLLQKELVNNAAVILTTLQGTNPQDRAMGLVSGDILGQNINKAKCAYSIQAIEQIEKYEPRLSVSEVDFEVCDSKIIPKVVLSYVG